MARDHNDLELEEIAELAEAANLGTLTESQAAEQFGVSVERIRHCAARDRMTPQQKAELAAALWLVWGPRGEA